MEHASKGTDEISPTKLEEQPQAASHANELESAEPNFEIDPVVEARVVRKLDYRVPVLLGTLCMSGKTTSNLSGIFF